LKRIESAATTHTSPQPARFKSYFLQAPDAKPSSCRKSFFSLLAFLGFFLAIHFTTRFAPAFLGADISLATGFFAAVAFLGATVFLAVFLFAAGFLAVVEVFFGAALFAAIFFAAGLLTGADFLGAAFLTTGLFAG